jgi:hypothetical protein
VLNYKYAIDTRIPYGSVKKDDWFCLAHVVDITNNLLINNFQFFHICIQGTALFVQILKKKIAQIQ